MIITFSDAQEVAALSTIEGESHRHERRGPNKASRDNFMISFVMERFELNPLQLESRLASRPSGMSGML